MFFWWLILDGCFLLIIIYILSKWLLLTLNTNKIPVGETGCLSNFLGYFSKPPALRPFFSDLERSPPALISTLASFDCLIFLTAQTFSFFIHPWSYNWQTTTHCAVPVWVTGRHATSLIPNYFPPNPKPQVLRIGESVFTLHSFLLFQGFPEAGS